MSSMPRKSARYESVNKLSSKEQVSVVQQMRLWSYWRNIFAEFIASFFYVLIVCETMIMVRETLRRQIDTNIHDDRGYRINEGIQNITMALQSRELLPTNLAFGIITGLSAMTLSWTFSDVSGGHVSPAVTAAMLFTRRTPAHTAAWYVIAQCFGSIAACATLQALTGGTHLGINAVHRHLGEAQAIGVEALITFLYVFTYFASLDKHRKLVPGGSLIAFGGAVTVSATFGVIFTGSSFNPARSLGPAIFEWYWTQHYVYWACPILGGCTGGIIYDSIFARNASPKRFQALFNDRFYNPDENPRASRHSQLNDVVRSKKIADSMSRQCSREGLDNCEYAITGEGEMESPV